jgi:endoglucanase
MFHELERLEATAAVYGLFTRAEEVGFVGAIALAKARVLQESVVIVSLETSSERGGACRMGDGVIVRVGDRTSIFDSTATSWLSHWARESQIPFQRCLMSGGTCEATAYQLYGFRTAALCVALGNYHNCGPEEKIDSEFVALADAEAMARLCTVAASAGALPDPAEALRHRLERESEQYRAYF